MSAEREQRCALKGTEQRLFNLVYWRATPEQWAVWLRAPLECAVHARDLGTTVALLKAGASPLCGEETDRLSDFLLTHPTSTDKRGDSIIHVACRLRHDHLVESILSKGADKEAFDKDGRSPLRIAVEHSNLSAVKALVSAGADFDLRSCIDNCTALDVAAIRAELEIMAALAAAGADVNGACSRGYTALHRAAFYNQGRSLELLLRAGARVDIVDQEGWTPLFDACAQGATNAIASLLRHGANGRHLDNSGRSVLHVAAEREHLDAVLLLLEHGEVDVGLRFGSSQSSALDFAVVAGNTGILRALIESGGADVNAAMIDGRTTLHRAAFFNKPTAIDALFEAGADLEANTNGNSSSSSCGWTPIFDACAEGCVDAVAALLKHNAAHRSTDSTGRTPLHVAAEAEQLEVCTALLDAGADPFLRYGEAELSVLDLAAREGNVDLIQAIAKARPTGLSWAGSRGYTALHHAAARDEGASVDALLEAGASVDAKDAEQGWTPLFDGCAKGSSDAVARLLERGGADPNVVDLEGRSPLHIAAQKGFRGVAELLLASNAGIIDVGRRFGKSESSAVDLAVVEGNLDVLMAILAYGRKEKNAMVVDLDATDSTGRTALHRGAFFDQVGAVGALLRGGARANARDGCGRTPLDVAIERGSTQTAALLSTTCPAPDDKDDDDDAPPPPPSYEELQRMLEAEVVALADTAWRRRRLLVMCRARLSPKQPGYRGGDADWPVDSAAPVAPASLFRTGTTAAAAAAAAGLTGEPGDGGPGTEDQESSAKMRPLPRAVGSVARRASAGCRGPSRAASRSPPKKGAAAAASPSKTMKFMAGAAEAGSLGGDGEEDEEMSAKTRPLRAARSSGSALRLPESGGGVAGVVERVLLLEEDGLFRNVVGFL